MLTHFTNIKTKIAFAAEDIVDAEYISKLLGSKTEKVTSGTTSTQTQGRAESHGYNLQAIPLLRPEEIMKLPFQKTLIIKSGFVPLSANKLYM